MLVFISTGYNTGYLFEGLQAVDILRLFADAQEVQYNGYGDQRIFEPCKAKTVPFEIIAGEITYVDDPEEQAVLEAHRQDVAKWRTEAHTKTRELKELQEKLTKLTAGDKEAKEKLSK